MTGRDCKNCVNRERRKYEPRIQTTRDIIQTTSRTQYDTATTSRQACVWAEHDIQVATQGHNA